MHRIGKAIVCRRPTPAVLVPANESHRRGEWDGFGVRGDRLMGREKDEVVYAIAMGYCVSDVRDSRHDILS